MTAPLSGFVPDGFFVLRSASLPFGTLQAWADGLSGDPAERRETLRARLRQVVGRPEVREAIYVASPGLEQVLDEWIADAHGERGRRAEPAIVRYVERMAGRATPFGLFAGCATGRLGGATQLDAPGIARRARHTRLDMDYLSTLAEALNADPALRRVLRHRPNGSLYRAAGRVRYVESRMGHAGRSHHLAAVDDSPYLAAALERAAGGARVDEVAGAIVAMDGGVGMDDALAFVDELIGERLLVSELAVPLTGEEPALAMAGVLAAHPEGAAAADALRRAHQRLRELDAADPGGVGPADYEAVAALLDPLPAPVPRGRLVQVDVAGCAVNATAGPRLVDEIARGLHLLHRLAPEAQDPLAAFRRAFVDRYDRREVPLLQALDEETGIGFRAGEGASDAAPLLAGLDLPAARAGAGEWRPRDAVLLRLLAGALSGGAHEIVLTDEDLAELENPGRLPLPDTVAARASVAFARAEDVDAGEFRVLVESASGASGARLLGRFCHADPALNEWVQRHLRAEEAHRPGAVFAEIVHMPQGRTGNIAFRPVLRGWEIPYIGTSGAPADRQIPASDLAVSVAGDRIVLRSRRLGREVVPRMTTAHDYSRAGMGVYRFLAMLQGQGVRAGVSWSWGPLASAPFLPRVAHGRVVLARAQWWLSADDLRALRAAASGAEGDAVARWAAERRLPRWITLAEGDNELPVDLQNPLSVDAFVDSLRGRDAARVLELFPAPEPPSAEAAGERYVHELVVPFHRPAAAPAVAPRPVAAREVDGTRRFAPGAEWLYLKLYTGAATADRVLVEAVAPLVGGMIASGDVDRWFFVRYGDPEWHLRIRLHGDPARLASRVLPALHAELAPLLDAGHLWRIQADTYEREVERYGGPRGVEWMERLAHPDSDAAVQVVAATLGDEGADWRWRMALAGADGLLRALGLAPAQQRRVLADMEAALAREFGVADSVKRHLSATVRRELRPCESLLAALAASPVPGEHPALAALRRRELLLAPLGAELRTMDAAGELRLPPHVVAGSLVHMWTNRVLRSAARAQELVLYHLLGRIYDSRAARLKSAGAITG